MSNTKGGLASALVAGLLGVGTAFPAWAEVKTGPEILPERPRPTWPAGHPALCSTQQRFCLHARDPRHAPLLSQVLAELESIAYRAENVLHWPSPLADGVLGGNEYFDLYFDKLPASSFVVLGDMPTDHDFADHASAFALLDPDLPASCLRKAFLAEAWIRAGLYRVDAGANHALATGTATYVASLLEPCEQALLGAVDDYQANPHAAISSDSFARGSMLFPWFLQTRYGVPQSVDLLHALWVHSQQRTPATNLRYVDRPDLIDVLRVFQKDRGATLADLLLDYSIARAFLGDRDDGMHMPDSTWLGSTGRVRFDARIDYSSLPKWVRPASPLEPTGATYLWLDVRGAPQLAGLGFRAEWETPAVFRFAFLRIGQEGTALSQFTPITQEKGTSIEVNVEDLSKAEALLIVGANVGALAGELKFDPDETPYEPQSYLITLVAQK